MRLNLLVLTTSYIRFKGDYSGNLVFEFLNRLNNKIKIKVVAPSDKDSLDYEVIENQEVFRFRYFSKDKQGVAYGGGIMLNLKKNPWVKFQIPLFFVSFLVKGLRISKDSNLIHAQLNLAGLVGAFIKKFRKIPLITSFYGTDVVFCRNHKFIHKPLMNWCDIFLVLCENMKKELVGIGFKEEKILVHHLGVDCNHFRYKEPKKSKNLVFLIEARFIEKKGIIYAIEAFSKVVKKYPSCSLRLVGGGPLEKEFIKKIEELNLINSVKIVKSLESSNPRKVGYEDLLNADIFLAPSIIASDGDKEGTPIIIMEAEAMGIPCIGSNHSGIPEIIVDGKTGFIVPEKDVNALTNKMIVLIENGDKRVLFSKNAREHIEKEFNQEKQALKLEEIYYNLLDTYGN